MSIRNIEDTDEYKEYTKYSEYICENLNNSIKYQEYI